MSLLVRGARLGFDGDCADIAVDGGNIAAVGAPPPTFKPQTTVEAQGLVAIPGLVDLGVYLREPGYEHKATIASETAAAAAGGITTLVCMPQTYPVVDSPTTVELIQNRANASDLCRVLVAGAITKELRGAELSEMGALKEAGCVAVGNLSQPFASALVLKRALEYAAGLELPVFFHPQDASLSHDGCAHEGAVATRLGLAGIPASAETAALSQCLVLAEDTGAAVHFCRLSCAQSVPLLREAQKSGLRVSADVAVHQLLLTEECLADFDSNYRVSPPLRSEDDRRALLAGLADGVIGAVCSDHQPHDLGSKLRPFPSSAPGISALETLLPLLLRLVERGELDAGTALRSVTSAPAGILGLGGGRLAAGEAADLCLFDPAESWRLSQQTMVSSGCNTPFAGQSFKGRVRYTVCGGKVVYEAA